MLILSGSSIFNCLACIDDFYPFLPISKYLTVYFPGPGFKGSSFSFAPGTYTFLKCDLPIPNEYLAVPGFLSSNSDLIL